MNYALIVYGAPYSQQAAHSALRFAEALPHRGHRAATVFFYHDGIYNATRLMTPPQDEPNLRQRWSLLAKAHNTSLLVCVASALKRGIVDNKEARRHGLDGDSLAPEFELTGLGQLLDAALTHDCVVTFGA
ncbi:sulfurtransferase complex subunit TusD [Phytohalomonas tamaricis]|uniref:sulfurtransferase complex subunit TusD n=1 Tax=Phytohalomonas tamaricis TaxID=2081032 RepID=UPI000D0BDFEA|nr:sulfurtransferase complex subunit TusD [Phytohalomonas tamaricis]